MRLSRPARRRASGLSYLPPLRPSLDEERSRFLLLSDGLLRVFPTEEVAPDGLVRQASCFLEVSDSFGVKAAAPEHASAVVRLVNGPLSAASTSGGTLNVPSPGVRNPSSRGTFWVVSRAG